MPDQFKEVTTKKWGSRLADAIKSVVMGILLFLGSFAVLYWNEGRVDLSKVAENAIEIQADATAAEGVDGQLVSTTGTLSSEMQLGDTYLAEGDYLAVYRNVEMYAWVEETEAETKTNTGGSETTETTYNYVKKWVSSPQDSSSFKIPEDHQNPAMTLEASVKTVEEASLGQYKLDMDELELPTSSSLSLNESNVVLQEGVVLADATYLFLGEGNLSAPEIGDMRMSYSVVNNPISNATVFGQLDQSNQMIVPFYGEKNTKLYRAFEGTRSEAISTLSTEHTVMTWILRILGFIMMWSGLSMLFRPLSVFLDVLPILGSISRVGVGIATFLVALLLSIVTILISMILHSLIALIIVVLVSVGLIIWFMRRKKAALQA